MQKKYHPARPYLIIVAFAFCLFFVLGLARVVRVGDGSEYYGLYYAWTVAHRPWMTPAAYQAYAALVDSHAILGMVPGDTLAHWFEVLRVGATSDFNHFWFYSLLAALCGMGAHLVGITLSPHQCFLALHLIAFSATASIAWRFHGRKGLVVIALMLLASPVLWFTDKAHTEFLTVCLLLSAIILLTNVRYLAAGLLLALASTQNPSFALIACIPVFYRVVLERGRAYSLAEVAMAVGIVLGVLLHPTYYFLRYGAVTPQLIAGGAALGRDLGTFYLWLIDPDLGLLPNWPIGCAMIVAGLVFRATRPRGASATDWRWLAFAGVYLLVNFFAHASTTNINSGATPGLARYALWYLPLLFPFFLRVVAHLAESKARRNGAIAVFLCLAVLTMPASRPRRSESYTTPSTLSFFIQKNLPGLYNPPVEVFLERYSGFGEEFNTKGLRAVVGPDCHKILMLPADAGHGAATPRGCMFDQGRLNALVDGGTLAAHATSPRYVTLTPAQATSLRVVLTPGAHMVGNGGDGAVVLGEGWSVPESWGVWSEQTRATLVLPCNESQFFGNTRPFTLVLALRPFSKQSITVTSGAGTLWSGPVASVDQPVTMTVPPKACSGGAYTLTLQIPGAVSPTKLGVGNDGRLLGVGLSRYEIRP